METQCPILSENLQGFSRSSAVIYGFQLAQRKKIRCLSVTVESNTETIE